MCYAGPRKVQPYSLEVKLTAVRMSHEPEIEVQAVAHALDVHPLMLSKWRKGTCASWCCGARSAPPPKVPKRELRGSWRSTRS